MLIDNLKQQSIDLQVQIIEKDSVNLTSISQELAYVTSSATGIPYEDILPDQMEHTRGFNFLVCAREAGTLLGYGGYCIYQSQEGLLLYESAKMVQKEAQGKGIGRKISQKALSVSPANFLLARTQNPAEILSIIRAFPTKKIAPLTADYTTERQMQLALATIIDHHRFNDVDPMTGICPGAYMEYGGQFGNYEPNLTIPDILAILDRLEVIGLSVTNGDGLILTVEM